MAKIWEPSNRFRIWFEIEAMPAMRWPNGIIPPPLPRHMEKGKWQIDALMRSKKNPARRPRVPHQLADILTEARFSHQA